MVAMMSDHAGAEEKEDLTKLKEVTKQGKAEAEFDESQIKIGGELNASLPRLVDGNEPQVTDIMHKMTYQKVVSDDKWGAIEMTSENIKAIKQHALENDFKSEEFFLEILERWEGGNFDKVDKYHNALWDAQNGNIGIAYDLMTEQQDRQFIEENFR
ncbi:hypothetical protein F9802_15070 [Bacillus aerolatus]|uniref:Uncharacterized protein n=1 Tax=Bacillus aerolatus TaxID=2653354 RepID=A0A6I1FHD6_9BACI|nr:DUF6241 domain-containing protein [Bacillus aerolatus]KAB7704887.1 hypothetical protein F9802_15070 [Bacillus aerolatus]